MIPSINMLHIILHSGIGILSLLYYHPMFNLERFDCPLPRELHYINIKNETVVSAVHYYNAYRFRLVSSTRGVTSHLSHVIE